MAISAPRSRRDANLACVDSDGLRQRLHPKPVAPLKATQVGVDESDVIAVVRAGGSVEWAVPVDVSRREGQGEGLEETVVEREVAGRRGFAHGELPELKEMLTGQVQKWC